MLIKSKIKNKRKKCMFRKKNPIAYENEKKNQIFHCNIQWQKTVEQCLQSDPEILHPIKMSFKYKCKTQTFSNMQELKRSNMHAWARSENISSARSRIKSELKTQKCWGKTPSGEPQTYVNIKAKVNNRGSYGAEWIVTATIFTKKYYWPTKRKMTGGEKEVGRTTVLVTYFLVGHRLVVSKIKIWCFWKHTKSNS